MRRPEVDVQWFFVEADAEDGLKAIALDTSASRVFDDAASANLHASMRDPRHRRALDRRRDIAKTLAKLPRRTVETLRLAYEPRGYAWENPLAEVIVRRLLSWSAANLVGVAIHSVPNVSPILALRSLETRAISGDPLRDVRRTAISEVLTALSQYERVAQSYEAAWWKT